MISVTKVVLPLLLSTTLSYAADNIILQDKTDLKFNGKVVG